jgi:hypothetical protein
MLCPYIGWNHTVILNCLACHSDLLACIFEEVAFKARKRVAKMHHAESRRITQAVMPLPTMIKKRGHLKAAFTKVPSTPSQFF